ncbi:MAG: hypothetical protein GY749_01580 [Desulfobacteraceae bacterium]|nr:hypothetical protein [Desulfobacteraceae bacterium]
MMLPTLFLPGLPGSLAGFFQVCQPFPRIFHGNFGFFDFTVNVGKSDFGFLNLSTSQQPMELLQKTPTKYPMTAEAL